MGREAPVEGHDGVTEARLDHICELMRSMQFHRGKTSKALAAQWGLSYERTKELCAEASKRVRAEVTDPDRQRGDLCVALQHILHRAIDSGQLREAVQAVDVFARILPPAQSGDVRPTVIEIGILPARETPAEEDPK